MDFASKNHTIDTERYLQVRKFTEKICQPLAVEDFVAQPAIDVSPPRWHLAHTTWFFENFILIPHLDGYKVFDQQYHFLFNSYYVQAGERWQRAERGYLTRPTVSEIFDYRHYVDDHMQQLLGGDVSGILPLIELSLQHEQQHQELLLYDIKYILGHNPLFPVYQEEKTHEGQSHLSKWLHIAAGNYQIGYAGDGFHFDNEKGVHTVFLHDFEICSHVITKGEFIEFIQQDGYANSPIWLDEGARWVRENEIKTPMYWLHRDGIWMEYTLAGLKPIDPDDPLVHISFYEADAYARWRGKRLPTEQEWEIACQNFDPYPDNGNFVENGLFRPIQQNGPGFFGNVWEWTASAYRPYPFYQAAPGAIGEYNGKFMINQMVLRGGSFGTSKSHIRATYRNFFHPHLRWLFSGARLAQDL